MSRDGITLSVSPEELNHSRFNPIPPRAPVFALIIDWIGQPGGEPPRIDVSMKRSDRSGESKPSF